MSNVLDQVLAIYEQQNVIKEKSYKDPNKIKKIFYDLETTGLNKETCGIIQFSGLIEIDGEVVEYFDFKMKPIQGKIMESKAMELANQRGITEEVINSYPEAVNVFKEIQKLFSKYVDKYNKNDKYFLLGYNNRGFDDDFLRKYWVDMKDNYFGSFFWQNTIDVMALASNYLIECRKNLPNFKLCTVANYLGIDVDSSKLHDAEYDIDLTYCVYKIVTSSIPCDLMIEKMKNNKEIPEYNFGYDGYDYYYEYCPPSKRIDIIKNNYFSSNQILSNSESNQEEMPF